MYIDRKVAKPEVTKAMRVDDHQLAGFHMRPCYGDQPVWSLGVTYHFIGTPEENEKTLELLEDSIIRFTLMAEQHRHYSRRMHVRLRVYQMEIRNIIQLGNPVLVVFIEPDEDKSVYKGGELMSAISSEMRWHFIRPGTRSPKWEDHLQSFEEMKQWETRVREEIRQLMVFRQELLWMRQELADEIDEKIERALDVLVRQYNLSSSSDSWRI